MCFMTQTSPGGKCFTFLIKMSTINTVGKLSLRKTFFNQFNQLHTVIALNNNKNIRNYRQPSNFYRLQHVRLRLCGTTSSDRLVMLFELLVGSFQVFHYI